MAGIIQEEKDYQIVMNRQDTSKREDSHRQKKEAQFHLAENEAMKDVDQDLNPLNIPHKDQTDIAKAIAVEQIHQKEPIVRFSIDLELIIHPYALMTSLEKVLI